MEGRISTRVRAGATEGVSFPHTRGTRAAHLAEGLPPGPPGIREVPRAARTSASAAPSGSDSDSESKPEARNSSTVSSARRLRVTTPESQLPASPGCPSPAAQAHGETLADTGTAGRPNQSPAPQRTACGSGPPPWLPDPT